jgi:hypothetical protein
MIGRLLCAMGLHRVVTTREGKATSPGSSRSSTPRVTGAASHIHGFCYRDGCHFHFIIDTHSGEKILHVDGNGHNVTAA